MAYYPKTKRQRLQDAIGEARGFQPCSPSADPELITGVTVRAHGILVRLQRLATPLLGPEDADLLNSLRVSFDDIYSAYDAWAVLEAVLPDIDDALSVASDEDLLAPARVSIVDPELISTIVDLKSAEIDCAFLARVCREVNSCFSQGHNIAAVLLMRTVLNAVPPVFGHETFAQVTANAGRSLKDSYSHLEDGLRKIADFHTHSLLGPVRPYPSAAQVEPFKPQFELLLHEVVTRLTSASS